MDSEEKVIEGLNKKKKDLQNNLDNILQPFKDAINKTSYTLNKITQPDVTEIKNTWDSLVFGKYLLQKIYEVFGENNEWDVIKKSIDVKLFKNFINLNPQEITNIKSLISYVVHYVIILMCAKIIIMN